MRFVWDDRRDDTLKAIWTEKVEDINLRLMKAIYRKKKREEMALWAKFEKASETGDDELEFETYDKIYPRELVNDALENAIDQVSKEKVVNHAKKALNDPKYLMARRKMAKEKVVNYVKKAIYDPERLITRKIMKRKLENPEPPKIKPPIIKKKRKEK